MKHYSAPAADLTCRIFRYLASSEHPSATLTQIARALTANVSSCLRVMRVLERERLVSYDPGTRLFSLGSYLYVLGSRAAEHVDFLRAALPFLKDVSEATGLTCALSERVSETELMYVAKQGPRAGLHVSMSVGERFPLLAGSHGKCHLAHLPEEERARLLELLGVQAFTPRTITDPARYRRELEKVRRDGYATSFEEWVTGVSGVSVPILSEGAVLGAMSASGFSAVMTRERVPEVAARLSEAARSIAAMIPSPRLVPTRIGARSAVRS